MSATFPHYVQPSSLPSDYALLSHFNEELDPPDTPDEESAVEDGNAGGIPIRGPNYNPLAAGPFGPASVAAKRRGTFSSVISVRPARPMLDVIPGTPAVAEDEMTPNETEPLLRRQSDASFNKEVSISAWKLYSDELKVMIKYSLPVFATQVLEYSLVLASIISIGHIGTKELAGCTLGSMTGGVTGYSIVQGFLCALDTLLPSAWTSEDPTMVGLWTQRMAVLMAVLITPMFMIWFQAESILLLLRQDPEVARLAALYLRYASLGLPAFAASGIAKRYFQSQGLMHVPTVITVIIAPVNIFFNWLLVWGPEPIRLGFKGAPLATAFSFNLIFVLFVIYGVFFAPTTAWCPITLRCFTRLPELFALGIAGTGMVVSEWWSWEIIGLAASMLGPSALAAQSVLLSTTALLWQAANALGMAAAVRVGNLLGASQGRMAGRACLVSILLTLVTSALGCGILVLFRQNWSYIFNGDTQVVNRVSQILPLCAFFQFFDAIQTVAGGVLRGQGKQTYGALINLTAYYVIGIPFGLWLTFKRDYELEGLWIGLSAALVYAAFVGCFITLSSNWDYEVEKVHLRFEAEHAHQVAWDVEQLLAETTATSTAASH